MGRIKSTSHKHKWLSVASATVELKALSCLQLGVLLASTTGAVSPSATVSIIPPAGNSLAAVNYTTSSATPSLSPYVANTTTLRPAYSSSHPSGKDNKDNEGKSESIEVVQRKNKCCC